MFWDLVRLILETWLYIHLGRTPRHHSPHSKLCHMLIIIYEVSFIFTGREQIHYIDVIITTMASQITSLTVVYSAVYSDTDQRKHQSSASLAFVWGIHRDRWIPHTKGQLRGKCFHLMTSSCISSILAMLLWHCDSVMCLRNWGGMSPIYLLVGVLAQGAKAISSL